MLMTHNTPSTHPRPFLTVTQIAHQLHFHRETILRHIRDGELRAVKFSREYRIDPVDFDDYLAKGLANGRKKKTQERYDA